MSICWPCLTTRISDSFDDHRNRTPPSTNPGTDIACGYGEEVWAVGDGIVTSITNDTNSAAGRYLTIALDEGGFVDQKLHLSRILVVRGQRVVQRQVVALSGASGFGSEWGYGAHLHQTFREGGRNVDFQHYASPASAAGGSVTPIQEDTLSASEVWAIQQHTQAVANNLQAYIENLLGQGRQHTQEVANNVTKDLKVSIKGIADGHILYPGATYEAFPALANVIREDELDPEKKE